MVTGGMESSEVDRQSTDEKLIPNSSKCSPKDSCKDVVIITVGIANVC